MGIIDKDTSRKKSKEEVGTGDIFKLRESRAKILDKKRGTGIPTAKGAVCVTKEKPHIDKIAKDLGIKEGVGIHEVIENSPASKAGITAGDVVLEVDRYNFEVIIDEKKHELKIQNDTDFSAVHLKELALVFKEKVKEETGKEFPQDADQHGKH